ncbi:hypothetical protein INT45_011443 [Circinella minor]|uniref:WRKY domain-containing protein n=1 Tax=Circinella minor TaxID=1195481 RepID=A0A8H7SAA2_9FUNG|nr:hypothetical protein INT45_011443 [Circinella minor]
MSTTNEQSSTQSESYVVYSNNNSSNGLPLPPIPIVQSGQKEKRQSLHDAEVTLTSTDNNAQQQNGRTHVYHYYHGPTPPNKLPLPPAPQSSTATNRTSSLSMMKGFNSIKGRPFAKRRRREMQAITMIIETREFPYNDDYLWKNNGNTIHKGSGNKSIYYKCANNQKGCPVNKTVTFKDNGEYLIKYRGTHLSDCSRIKRVVDV